MDGRTGFNGFIFCRLPVQALSFLELSFQKGSSPLYLHRCVKGNEGLARERPALSAGPGAGSGRKGRPVGEPHRRRTQPLGLALAPTWGVGLRRRGLGGAPSQASLLRDPLTPELAPTSQSSGGLCLPPPHSEPFTALSAPRPQPFSRCVAGGGGRAVQGKGVRGAEPQRGCQLPRRGGLPAPEVDASGWGGGRPAVHTESTEITEA